jgi:hypothetical protein
MEREGFQVQRGAAVGQAVLARVGAAAPRARAHTADLVIYLKKATR